MSGTNKRNLFKRQLTNLKNIGLDSTCFIYQFTKHPFFSQLTEIIFDLLERNKISTVTSMVTVVEIFVHEERVGDSFTLRAYEKIFSSLPHLEVKDIDWNTARFASKLRSKYRMLKTPDALQLSTAILNGCNGFITNDEKLKKVNEIKVLLLKDFIPS